MRKSVRVKGIAIVILLLFTFGVSYAAWREDVRGRLTVSFLDVGQGSAIYIEAPSGQQALIDGGPDGSVLRALGSVMPPWDRSLDVVIATSPDQDDVSGLVDVLQRYAVGTVVQTGVESTTPVWNLFEKEAADTKILTAQRGQIIDLGKGAYIEILFPDRAAPGVSSAEGCVVARLVYGKTAFMLACDATAGVQNYLSMLDGTKLKSDVLFAYASSTPIFFGYVAPQFTVNACKKSGPCGATFVSDGQTVVRK